jgi:phosphomevalonate kinase
VFEIFRPDIMDLVADARDRLLAVKDIRNHYADKDIPGLGKNFLSNATRQEAIEAYSYYLKYYALSGLVRKLMESGKPDKEILNAVSKDGRFEHERKVLGCEIPGIGLKDALGMFLKTDSEVAANVLECKRKDDVRGMRIIDDYAEAHTLAADEKFIKEVFTDTEKRKTAVESIIAGL